MGRSKRTPEEILDEGVNRLKRGLKALPAVCREVLGLPPQHSAAELVECVHQHCHTFDGVLKCEVSFGEWALKMEAAVQLMRLVRN